MIVRVLVERITGPVQSLERLSDREALSLIHRREGADLSPQFVADHWLSRSRRTDAGTSISPFAIAP